MFHNIAVDNNGLLRLILSHMADNGYDLPHPPNVADQVHYSHDSGITYPSLVSFSNVSSILLRTVHVKLCGRPIAKTLIYAKTRKLRNLAQDMNSPYSWAMCPSMDSYEHIIESVDEFAKRTYYINHVIYPREDLIRECMSIGKPFLLSYSVIYDADNNNRRSLKIFIVTRRHAKSLVYLNKNCGYEDHPTAAVHNHSDPIATTTNHFITMTDDSIAITCSNEREENRIPFRSNTWNLR